MTVLLGLALALFATLLNSGAAAAAEEGATMYTKGILVLQDAAGGNPIATVLPAAEVVVRATSGDFVQVDVTGWSPQGGEKYLFKAAGIRISLAVMTDNGVGRRRVRGSKDDDWGSTWEEVTLTGWVPAAELGASLDDLWAIASDLYHSRCSRCHSLRRPEEFTANQWPSVLKIMTKRAGFTAVQAAQVTALLQNHAKDQHVADAFTEAVAAEPVVAEPAPVPEIVGTPEIAAAGKDLFDNVGCSACHGEDARTPALPEYPRIGGQSAEYAYKQMLDFRAGARNNDAFGVMKDITADLSDADLTALAYWLSQQ